MDASWCSTIAGSSVATRRYRQREVPIEVEVQWRVEEDRHEPRPARCLLGLGAAAFPLLLEAEARDHADDRPAPVEQVEERAGAADGLVVGVGRDVEDGGSHGSAGVPGQGLVDETGPLGIVVGQVAGDKVAAHEQCGRGGLGRTGTFGGGLGEQAGRLHGAHEQLQLSPEVRRPVRGIGDGSSQAAGPS